MQIITGYTGTPHITALQDRAANQGAYGTGSHFLNVGNKMSATIVSNNEVRISDGILSHQGCLGIIAPGTYDSMTIANGSQSMNRNDLIVCRYERDSSNIESMSLVVIQGTAVSGTPADPTYNTGDIQNGDSPVDMPLYRVAVRGTSISLTQRLATILKTQAETDTLLGSTSLAGIANGTVTGALAINDDSITPAVGVQITHNRLSKIGRLCVFNFKGTIQSSISSGATIGSVVSGYRPAVETTVVGCALKQSTGELLPVPITFGTAGYITTQAALYPGTLWMTGSYMS